MFKVKMSSAGFNQNIELSEYFVEGVGDWVSGRLEGRGSVAVKGRGIVVFINRYILYAITQL